MAKLTSIKPDLWLKVSRSRKAYLKEEKQWKLIPMLNNIAHPFMETKNNRELQTVATP
jgi:hypothetical protein